MVFNSFPFASPLVTDFHLSQFENAKVFFQTKISEQGYQTEYGLQLAVAHLLFWRICCFDILIRCYYGKLIGRSIFNQDRCIVEGKQLKPIYSLKCLSENLKSLCSPLQTATFCESSGDLGFSLAFSFFCTSP